MGTILTAMCLCYCPPMATLLSICIGFYVFGGTLNIGINLDMDGILLLGKDHIKQLFCVLLLIAALLR